MLSQSIQTEFIRSFDDGFVFFSSKYIKKTFEIRLDAQNREKIAPLYCTPLNKTMSAIMLTASNGRKFNIHYSVMHHDRNTSMICLCVYVCVDTNDLHYAIHIRLRI